MLLIKRYPNRKLYDTEAKQYITLQGIANFIREGQEVQVIDYTSGEDLTAVTLTQIIFEQEKRQSGFLPRSMLADLIQTGGDRLNALQRNLTSQLGLTFPADEEIRRRVQILIHRGELAEAEGRRLLEKLLDLGLSSHSIPVELEIEHALQKRGIPTRSDLDRILAQLNALDDELEKLNKPQ